MELTIFILSINRHQNLINSLSYWSRSNYKVFILDASQRPLKKNFPKNINYIHKPNLSMFKRCKIALSLLNTKFFCFCADDDFHIFDNLKYFYNKLDNNFSSSQGIIFKFGKNNDRGKFLYTAYNNVYKSIIKKDLEKRILYFSKNLMMPLCYSVCRKKVLQTFCNLTNNLEKSPQFVLFEEFFALSVLIEGSFKFINLPYGFRLQHQNKYLTSKNYDTHTLKDEFNSIVFRKKLKNNLMKILKRKNKLKNNIRISSLIEDFLTNYQNKIKSTKNIKIRKMINKNTKFLSLKIGIKKLITILKTNKINYKLYKSFFRSWNRI